MGRGLALAGAGIVTAVAVTTLAVVLPPRVATDQYVSLVDTLRAHERPGDRVLLYPDEDWPLFAAKYPGTWDKAPAGMDYSPESVASLLQPVWAVDRGPVGGYHAEGATGRPGGAGARLAGRRTRPPAPTGISTRPG